MLPLRQQNFDREELFIGRYASLRDQAMRLTDRNATEAEDLLHDAFIHFTLSQTPVEEIQNLDGYLYTMLRNLRLSQARRLARTPQGHLSLIDYDSAEAGLNSTDPRDKIKAQDELRAIAQYACVRKDTSKAGGVLILRFFHGYFPNEIAKVLRSPRSAVDNLLQTARREARLYKADPDALTFLHADKAKASPEFAFGQLSTDILTEVRGSIFTKPDTDCPNAKIKDIYDANESEEKPVTAGFLSHIATCRTCLDEVNETLGLPTLASRLTADEPKSTDKKPRSGGGSSGGGMTSTDAFLKRSRTRLKQVFEHRPEELLISVNGFIIGSQRINSEKSELALSVKLDEKIGFVEVFSERDVRMLFEMIEPPPDGLAIQPARVELSDGRQLELLLDFTDNWPQIYASYRDPSFSDARAGELTAETPRRRDDVTANLSVSPVVTGGLSRLTDWFRDINASLWLRPERITAAFAILLVVTLAIWKLQTPAEPVTVASLLEQTATAEHQLAGDTDIVVHKAVMLEERDQNGAVLASRKIETYQSGEQQLTVRRLFDEQGKLLAGEWKRGDGSRTLYSNKEKPKIETAAEQNTPTSIDDAWLLDASVADFLALVAEPGSPNPKNTGDIPAYVKTAATVTEDTRAYYTIAYQPETVRGGLVNAQLKISKEDRRVIEQMLLVQQGDRYREYRYTEASYQKLSPRSVQPSVFEPERELLATLLKNLKIGTAPGTDSTDSVEAEENTPPATAGGTDTSVTNAATADLEVEALNLLNQAGADTGEQVTVKRINKTLRIDGIVDNDKRKAELQNALSPIANNPAVRINIMTVAEALAREQSRKQKAPTSVERINTAGSELPVKDQLQKYFGSEEAANNFAARAIGRSRSAMSRAGALKRLIGQFTLAQLKELSPDARAKWLNLVRLHARGFAQETAALRQDLSPVFGAGGGSSSPPFKGGVAPASGDGVVVRDDAALIRAVTRLFELSATGDRTVRNALSISTDRSASALSQDFFRSLRTTESLAAAIQEYK